MIEKDDDYLFVPKVDIVSLEEVRGFMLEQFHLFPSRLERHPEYIGILEDIRSIEELIEQSDQSRHYYLQTVQSTERIECGKWNTNVYYNLNMICFIMEGKIIMEGYNNYLRYMETLVRKASNYKISGAMKFIIQ